MVGPRHLLHEPRRRLEGSEHLARVLVGILGVDHLALGKMDRQAGGGDLHDLLSGADQIDLDTIAVRLVNRLVRERLDYEIGPEFPVDPVQQVEIECRGHSPGIVIGRFQYRSVLGHVRAEQQMIVGLHPPADHGQ